METNRSPALSSVQNEAVANLAAKLSLPSGLVVHKPAFKLGICDDPQFGLPEVEEGELSSSNNGVGSCPPFTSAEEVALLEGDLQDAPPHWLSIELVSERDELPEDQDNK